MNGLALQGYEHKRIQEFELGAAQKRNVQMHYASVPTCVPSSFMTNRRVPKFS